MSFSSEVKKELEKVTPTARHCRLAALATILFLCGEVRFLDKNDARTDRIDLLIHSERQAETRKVFTLLRKSLNIECELQQVKRDGSGSAKEPARIALSRAGFEKICAQLQIDVSEGMIRDFQEIVSPSLLERECCGRTFLREAFISCGSITDPSKDYHLEFDCFCERQAQQVQEVLRTFDKSAGIVLRGKMYIVYLKDSDDIVDTLNLMGAPVSMMAMENQRILKDLRNSVNRRVNCETANIGKTVSASRKQIEEIGFLEEKGILRTLPESLQQIAMLRVEYPDLPLRELGEMANPPIGKSGVNHRLRRLVETAEKYRAKQGEMRGKND